MELLLFITFAPILILALYVYWHDKYEKEPIGLLIIALLLGALIVIPVIYVEIWLGKYWEMKFGKLFTGDLAVLASAAYVAFIVAALTEETFKYIAFFYFWKNKHFNELFDGIIYAVFISLGFAAVENVLYVFHSNNGGMVVGMLRAITAVPAHALFGVAMGYYLGLAKFEPKHRIRYLFLALCIPIILHGLYDFILMAENEWLFLLFIPYIIILWVSALKRMRLHSHRSVFKR